MPSILLQSIIQISQRNASHRLTQPLYRSRSKRILDFSSNTNQTRHGFSQKYIIVIRYVHDDKSFLTVRTNKCWYRVICAYKMVQRIFGKCVSLPPLFTKTNKFEDLKNNAPATKKHPLTYTYPCNRVWRNMIVACNGYFFLYILHILVLLIDRRIDLRYLNCRLPYINVTKHTIFSEQCSSVHFWILRI